MVTVILPLIGLYMGMCRRNLCRGISTRRYIRGHLTMRSNACDIASSLFVCQTARQQEYNDVVFLQDQLAFSVAEELNVVNKQTPNTGSA